MRLNRLDLTRYGKFTDRVLDFGPRKPGSPDLHVVYGLNEAGKSTAFSAYLDLLFGIHNESPYGFLHGYSTMQIGGVLDLDGQEQEFTRVKKRSSSLLDKAGQPLPEAILASALGGLTREAYRAMFSLDDQSLRMGGEAIVESKGELGELLFSASSGLAELSRILSGVNEEAQLFHKKRARSTQLAELKQRLAAIKTERDQIDTYATAYAGLVAGRDQAQQNYDDVLSDLATTRTRHAELQAKLRAFPILQDLSRLRQELSAHVDLPRPPREWFNLLPDMMRDETRLHTLKASTAATIERLQAEISAINLDDSLLQAASDIAGLTEEHGRYLGFAEDLPKRRLELKASETLLAQNLKALGRADEQDPQKLILPAALAAKLRDLIETRSGISATLSTARREMLRATETEALMRARLAAHDETPVQPAKLRQIQAAIEALDKGDLPAQLAFETRALNKARADAKLTTENLLPWEGSIEELKALDLPDPRQVDSWRFQAQEIERQRLRLVETRNELRGLQASAEVKLKTVSADARDYDDEAARDSRWKRSEAWEAHLESLTLESARAFEAAMREDDRLTQTRLARSGDLVEWRRLTQENLALQARLEQTDLGVGELSSQSADLLAEIYEHLPFASERKSDHYAALAQLERFRTARDRHLDAVAALQEAKDRHNRLAERLEAETAAFEDLLGEIGMEPRNDEALAEKLALARNWLEDVRRRMTEKDHQAQRLEDLVRDMRERSHDLEAAVSAEEEWQRQWQATLAASWFATETEPSAVRAILDTLAELPGLVAQRDQLDHRVTLMERNMAGFAQKVAALAQSLGWSETDIPVTTLADRLFKAQQAALKAEEERAIKEKELARAETEWSELELRLASYDAQRREFASYFNVESLSDVSAKLKQVEERDKLEQSIVDYQNRLLTELAAADLATAEQALADFDAQAARLESAQLAESIENLSESSRKRYAELTRAKERIDAVGGDDAVVRLEAERSTILVEVQELALNYLKLRAGTMAAENALSIYREQHRSSMMRRASAAFSQITRGEYSGLSTVPDRDREILIGVGKDGGSKESQIMSTGTRYQLYLALRLAGYEEFAAVRPSVPFIADDIMESFDEPRSEEVFRQFGRMAELGQVIYLTHHRHLCDIAAKTVPGVQIHEL